MTTNATLSTLPALIDEPPPGHTSISATEPFTALAPMLVGDPATLGFHPFFPVELALGESPPRVVCAAYGITRTQLAHLISLPAFQAAYIKAKDLLKKDGMSFKIKAQMQSEELLKTSWKLIHGSATPPSVKADLIKTTYRVAGLEPKESSQGNVIAPLQINISL